MIVLTLMILPLVLAEIPINKKCEDYTSIPPAFTLELDKLTATSWYEISSYAGGDCVQDTVMVTEDNTLNLVHYQMGDGDLINTTATATVDQNTLEVTIGATIKTVIVLKIDYDKYAVLWTCTLNETDAENIFSTQDLWILSKNITNLSELDEVNTLLTTVGLSTKELKAIAQDEDTCSGTKIALSFIAATTLFFNRVI